MLKLLVGGWAGQEEAVTIAGRKTTNDAALADTSVYDGYVIGKLALEYAFFVIKRF